MKAALLFWENLANALQEWGFEIDPYDWCVANKEINGSQCTVVWHVDNLKILHKDANVVTEIIDTLLGKYGKEKHMTVTREKIHKYFGMMIDFTTEDK
eukprot:3402090-Ditylum_brightwellii.AAC.1